MYSLEVARGVRDVDSSRTQCAGQRGSVGNLSYFNKMNIVKDGWFSDVGPLWKGQAFSLEVDKVLFHEKSKYQDVLVLKR